MNATARSSIADYLAPREVTFSRVLAGTLLVQAMAAVPYGIFAAMQSRMLGAAGRGDVAIAVTIAFFAVAVADLGFTAVMPYWVGRRRANGLTLLGNFVGWSAAALPVVLLGLAGIAAWGNPPVVRHALADHSFAIAAMIAANQVYNFARFEALSWKEYASYNVLSAVAQATMPLALVTVFVVAPQHVSVTAVLGCYTAGYGMASIVGAIRARSRLRIYSAAPWMSIGGLVAHLRVGLNSLVSVIAGQLLMRLDVLLLFSFGQPVRDIGFYSVAVLLAALWNQVPSWTATALGPKAAHDDPDHRAVTIRLASAALALSALAGGVFVALMPVLPWLLEVTFGEGFGRVYGLLLLLAPRLILLPAGEMLGGNLAGRGYGMYHPLATVVALIASVGLNLLLIPRFGISGAASSMGLSYVLQFTLMLRGFCVTNALTFRDIIEEVQRFSSDVQLRLRRPV